MKQIILRSFGFIIGSLLIAFQLLVEDFNDGSTFSIVRNLLISVLFLAYALGGNKLMKKIPLFRHLNETNKVDSKERGKY